MPLTEDIFSDFTLQRTYKDLADDTLNRLYTYKAS